MINNTPRHNDIVQFRYIMPSSLPIQPIPYTDATTLLNVGFVTIPIKHPPIVTQHNIDIRAEDIYNQSYEKINTTNQQDERVQGVQEGVQGVQGVQKEKLEMTQLQKCNEYINVLKNMLNEARKQHQSLNQ